VLFVFAEYVHELPVTVLLIKTLGLAMLRHFRIWLELDYRKWRCNRCCSRLDALPVPRPF
jgi:hypothetical protein